MCDLDPYYGDWRINNQTLILYNKDLLRYLKKDKLKLVKFNDIGWKGKDINHPLLPERYDRCDIKIPCILTEGTNPYNYKYRMIDGRHRITKMNNMGIKESVFYIIDFNIFLNLLQQLPIL